MTASLTLVVLMAVLFGAGVSIMLERSLTRVLIGFLLVGNAVNILIYLMSGAPGLAPLLDEGVDPDEISDPLPQVFVLTAIVINLGITAFMLALLYRSWWLAQLGARGDLVDDEVEIAEDAEETADLIRSSAADDQAIQEIIDASDEERSLSLSKGTDDRAGSLRQAQGTKDDERGASVTAVLVPLVVLLPLLGAAAALILGRRRRAQMAVGVGVLAAVAVIAAILLVAVDTGEPVVVAVGGWDAPWGITLVVDRLSALMLVISSIVLLVVLVYSVGQGIADRHRETPVSIFHPSYLILSAGVFSAFIAGDLFNLFVSFEILLSASYVLLTLGGTGERIRAGVTYIIVSLVSSLFFLSAIALIYGATGTANIAQLSVRLAELPPSVQLMLHLLLLIAFGIKAAIFPLSFWLPDSYPTAPAPVTAVFAGLLTKVGVYAIIRTETVIFAESDVSVLLMVVGGLTMVIGILGALTQADIKRLLSFTLVSHIGYMIFGISLASQLGLTATIYYVVHHITVQTTLFLTTGLIERIGGATSINRLAGLLKASPLLAVLFFIPALNLGGIPPFSGFLGKTGLFLAGAESANADAPGTAWLVWVVIAAGAATSLVTLYALTRFWNMAFWRRRSELEGYESVLLGSVQEAPEGATVTATRTTPVLMVVATTALVVLTVCLTVFAGPLFELAGRAAADLSDPAFYVSLVFPGGIR